MDANTDDGSCQYTDECGVCGDGIPAGDCDCDGNQLDALGVCMVTALQTPMPMASVTTWTTV